ncbi:MAG: RNase adapter RapZ [Raoultibacter sp.]
MSDSPSQKQAAQAPEVLGEAAPLGVLEPDLIIITGMSGAGRTEAVHTFEDLGYYCIDNLPPNLLMSLVSLANIPGQPAQSRRLAVVCDARNQDFFFDLFNELAHLKDAGLTYRIIFLDASDESLLARYKASRRRHPLCDRSMTITQGIARERKLLAKVREAANAIIDTSTQKPRELRDRLRSLFAEESDREGLNVIVYSFGFKHGAPADADIVIDVRFLPNPFYEPELRCLTGLDAEVRDYVIQRRETKEFLDRWCALLSCIMPGYVAEGKQQLAIAVGCTGGQHRSVALAVATGAFLRSERYQVSVTHRDIALAETVVEKH